MTQSCALKCPEPDQAQERQAHTRGSHPRATIGVVILNTPEFRALVTGMTTLPPAESREVVYDDHQLQPLVTNYKQITLQMSRQ
jgi:hypothetical protein